MSATIEKRKPNFTQVEALRPGTKGHTLNVKVIDAKVVVNKARGGPGGVPLRLAECLVGDETGVIIFTARNEQVDVCKAGSFITLRNAKIDMYRGSMRLAVDQWGKVESCEELQIAPKEENNLSLVEYELVTVSADQAGRS